MVPEEEAVPPVDLGFPGEFGEAMDVAEGTESGDTDAVLHAWDDSIGDRGPGPYDGPANITTGGESAGIMTVLYL